MPIRALTVLGTRPEAIKLAPLIAEFRSRDGDFHSTVASTGQHRELLDPVLEIFGIEPDYDLSVMEPVQDPREVLSRVLLELRPVLDEVRPDLLVVQGDTTTTLAAALCAAHQKIPVAHVEAGLRSSSVLAPFPEETNRRLTSQLSAYHFAPTEAARQNLLAEGIDESPIAVTGNTVVDALRSAEARLEREPVDLGAFTPGLDWRSAKVILVTGHRRESFGEGFEEICAGLDRVAARNPDAHIVYPVHLNPRVREVVKARLGGRANIHLIEPVGYLPFVQMMTLCHFILTDSGGIQEEAASLRKPVLVMRDRTERIEAIEAGVAKLIGTRRERIADEAQRLLEDPGDCASASTGSNPFGDGRASRHIADFLLRAAPLTVESAGCGPAE